MRLQENWTFIVLTSYNSRRFKDPESRYERVSVKVLPRCFSEDELEQNEVSLYYAIVSMMMMIIVVIAS